MGTRDVRSAVSSPRLRQDPSRGTVMIEDPAVEASTASGPLPLGTEVTVTLVEANPVTRTVR